jgi:hypothetical protein
VIDCGNLTVPQVLNEGAIDRLVLASGGVVRDFLAIFQKHRRIAMKKQPVDAKKAAANDKENGNGRSSAISPYSTPPHLKIPTSPLSAPAAHQQNARRSGRMS